MNKLSRIIIALMAIIAGAYLTLVVASFVLKIVFAVCAVALVSLILLQPKKKSPGDKQ